MAEKDKYIIKVEGKLVEVTPEVYYAYFRMERQERGQEEKKQQHDVISYDALDSFETVGKGVASPIVGATKVRYLDDAVGALEVKLTAEDIAYLEDTYLPHRIVGAIDHNPADGVILLDEKK